MAVVTGALALTPRHRTGRPTDAVIGLTGGTVLLTLALLLVGRCLLYSTASRRCGDWRVDPAGVTTPARTAVLIDPERPGRPCGWMRPGPR